MNALSVGDLFLRLFLSLGVVIGVMALAAAGLRRLQGGVAPRRTGRPVRIEVVARQSLGRRSSVALIRAGERGFVLGVTDQHVTLLAETSVDELVIEEAPRTVPSGLPAGPPWRNLTEQLRERTVRRS